ncbi:MULTISPECIES: acyl-CoA dehydrogenase [Gordonia]|uniref:acyl-CoA dehydrogenase n=1 Tax=Gordonia TaxID=2053 RepID=UPI00133122CE|nr:MULTISPECIES: acyl-CoA dehydrogenase [Gordonia]KAF0967693.1 putative FMNH2-dependent monooxygenase SfnC [Gordonia sp. YY1]UPW14265.1 acyl-CoA dehydrogenase [Gordonia amicalis]
MSVLSRVVADRSAILSEIGADAAVRELTGIDPHAQVRLLSETGYTALTLDDGSGPGAGTPELFGFLIDLARADPIVAHILRAHYWFVEQIRRFPDGPVRDRWVAEIAAGKVFGNATSERTGSAGSLSFQTELEAVDGGWLLTGAKFYSTGTAFSDYVSVTATVRGGEFDGKIARIVLPVDRDGVTVVDDWDGIGQNRTGTGTTTLDRVPVSADDVLAFTDPASAAPLANDGPFLQLYLQALITGILLSVGDDATTLLRSRTRTFDHAPVDSPRHDPVLLGTVGEIDAAAHVARAAVLDAAQTIEEAFAPARSGEIDPDLFIKASVAAARVKVHVDRVGLRAAADLFDVGGASSASRTTNLDRHWRNIRTVTLHNPTSYKAIALGDLLVNDTPLPANGYF